MKLNLARRSALLGTLMLGMAALVTPLQGEAQALKGGRLRVALVADPINFDPAQFSSNNFPLIKNLYDSLIEYTAEGQAIPSLASAWTVGPGNNSVTLTLRRDVTFHSGAPMNAASCRSTWNTPWHSPITGTPVSLRIARQIAVIGLE